MARSNEKSIDYYFSLKYPYITVDDEDDIFVEFPDLPGCITQVERGEDVHATAQEIKELWLETALAAGQHIPEPMSEEYSGKFVARIPKSLHRNLSLRAKREGVSLNALVNHLLSSGIGESVSGASETQLPVVANERVAAKHSNNHYTFIGGGWESLPRMSSKRLNRAR